MSSDTARDRSCRRFLRRHSLGIELIYGTLIAQVLVVSAFIIFMGSAGGEGGTLGSTMGGMFLVGVMPFIAIGLGASAPLCLSAILGGSLAVYLALRYVPGPYLRFMICALECGWLAFGTFVSSYAGIY